MKLVSYAAEAIWWAIALVSAALIVYGGVRCCRGGELQLVTAPMVRPMGSGVWGDIASRLGTPDSSEGNRPATQAHAGTHEIHSRLRQQYGGTGRVNAVYLLDGRAAVLREPPVTMAGVAATVPHSLRGMAYDLYLRKMQQWWNREPLYVCDEWTAYLHGTLCGLQRPDGGGQASDLTQAIEFAAYGLALLAEVERSDYADKPALRQVVRILAERTGWAFCKATAIGRMRSRDQDQYLQRLLFNADAARLRATVAGLYGEAWLANLWTWNDGR